MSSRRCRTCPAIFEGGGSDDQCPACLPRSVAVKPVVGNTGPGKHVAVKLSPAEHMHHACEHYWQLLAPIQKWIVDMEWCAVCGAETPQDAPDGAPVPHRATCAMLAIGTAAPPAAADGQ